MARKEVDFEHVAMSIMFDKDATTPEDIIKKHSLEYRKGKDASSIQKAIQLAYAKKSYKTEQEIDWLALYLKQVFKKFEVKSL